MRSDFDISIVHCLGLQFFRGHSVCMRIMLPLKLTSEIW